MPGRSADDDVSCLLELEHLREQLQGRDEEEKENRQVEERKVPMVEELKEEIKRLQERRRERQLQENTQVRLLLQPPGSIT